MAAINATYRSYSSGAASEILDWPRVYFWLPVAFSLGDLQPLCASCD